MIGIALLVAGITRTSRGDDGRNFADQTKFTKIDIRSAAGFTLPLGINPRDDIVGVYSVILNQSPITYGFLLRKGTFYKNRRRSTGSGSGEYECGWH
jgi:hypothetical protein